MCMLDKLLATFSLHLFQFIYEYKNKYDTNIRHFFLYLVIKNILIFKGRILDLKLILSFLFTH